MPNTIHILPINAPVEKVFEVVSTAAGLEKWWSASSSGKSAIGETFHLLFEPDYHWTAIVSKLDPPKEFELTIQKSDADWEGIKIGFRLSDKDNATIVEFYNHGWKEANEHFGISNYCWAMYLRILKRYIEFGEFVPYSHRLDA